jgi:hypothetical protein
MTKLKAEDQNDDGDVTSSSENDEYVSKYYEEDADESEHEDDDNSELDRAKQRSDQAVTTTTTTNTKKVSSSGSSSNKKSLLVPSMATASTPTPALSVGGGKSRSNLQTLVGKFVDVLKQNEGKSLDVPAFADAMGVDKRRIYDVTCVLEACSLISKKDRTLFQWSGPFSVQKIPSIHLAETNEDGIKTKRSVTPSSGTSRKRTKQSLSPEDLQKQNLIESLKHTEASLDKTIDSVLGKVTTLASHSRISGRELRNSNLFLNKNVFVVEAPAPITVKIPPPIFDPLAKTKLHQICIIPTRIHNDYFHTDVAQSLEWIVVGEAGKVVRTVAQASASLKNSDPVSATALFVTSTNNKNNPPLRQHEFRSDGDEPITASPELALTQQTIGTFTVNSQSQHQQWKLSEPPSLGFET